MDLILVDYIRRLIKELKSNQLISSYFFIRYLDENGPHIRLRILPKNMILQEEIDTLITTGYQIFLEEKGLSLKDKTVFLNSAYIPETERYGGPKLLPFCEKFFNASSEAVLLFLDKSNTRGYDARFSQAMVLNLVLAYHIRRNLGAVGLQDFLTMIISAWLKQGVSFSKAMTIDPQENVDRSSVLQQFREILDSQRTRIFALLETVWISCETGDFSEFPDLKKWNKENILLFDKISRELNKDQKKYPSGFRPFEGLLHMTNNRLGVKTYDESFIAYILMEFINSKTDRH